MGPEALRIAEAFCSHRFAETYPHMADDIRWNMVGSEDLVGRGAVIERCTASAQYLEGVTTTSLELKVIPAEDCVIVEGSAQFLDQAQQTSSVASCDIFRFSDERLAGITSYVIELGK